MSKMVQPWLSKFLRSESKTPNFDIDEQLQWYLTKSLDHSKLLEIFEASYGWVALISACVGYRAEYRCNLLLMPTA